MARTLSARLSWMHSLHNRVAGPSVSRHADIVLIQTNYAIALHFAGESSPAKPRIRDFRCSYAGSMTGKGTTFSRAVSGPIRKRFRALRPDARRCNRTEAIHSNACRKPGAPNAAKANAAQ